MNWQILRNAGAITLAVTLAAAGQSHAGRFTQAFSGPNSAFVSDSVIMSSQSSPLLSTVITTGTSGRILIVQVTLEDNSFSGAGQVYDFQPQTDAGPMEMGRGGPAFVTTDGYGNAIASGTWWLDIDAAGLANQPLYVNVYGSTLYPNGNGTVNMSLTAYTVQK